MLGLARRMNGSGAVANEVFRLSEENEKIRVDAVKMWGDLRDEAPFKYFLLTVSSYVGTFSAPEDIGLRINFIPGIIEVILFLALGCFFFWFAGKEPTVKKKKKKQA